MPEDVLQQLAAKVDGLLGSWSAVELRVRMEQTYHLEGRKGLLIEEYIETALGQRLYELASTHSKTGIHVRHVAYSDGNRFATARWQDSRQTEVVVQTSFGTESTMARADRAYPLRFLYVNHRPLSSYLPTATHEGTEARLGRKCELVLVANQPWGSTKGDAIYSLDRETGFPLRILCYFAGSDRNATHPMLVWEAKSFDRVAPGQNWPLRSVEELYVPVETSPARHVLTTNLTIDSIKFDQIYASTLFWPTEEPGATVWNQVENSHWIVPGKDPGAKEKKTTAAQVQPIDMDPPRDATSSIAFGAILMGVTCLLVGALIWWRRRVA